MLAHDALCSLGPCTESMKFCFYLVSFVANFDFSDPKFRSGPFFVVCALFSIFSSIFAGFRQIWRSLASIRHLGLPYSPLVELWEDLVAAAASLYLWRARVRLGPPVRSLS